jgi:hypothetical protein
MHAVTADAPAEAAQPAKAVHVEVVRRGQGDAERIGELGEDGFAWAGRLSGEPLLGGAVNAGPAAMVRGPCM